MSDKLTTLGDDTRIVLANLADYATGLVTPTVRLGVTGLSRAGKTVFITSLIHNLLQGGRLPVFEAASSGRLAKATREPQPDDAVPTFAYEDHVATLIDARAWPQSTRRISQTRLTLVYESASWLSRNLGGGRLHLDIVDYPGEWLLDLPLLAKDYATWSREAIELSRLPNRRSLAAHWHARMADVNAAGPESETTARELATAFTDYLRACRADEHALSTLPPGRFLMPGDLEGSPALTFAPLAWPDGPGVTVGRTLFQMMERRYEAYKDVVVRPFFRDHFARLDRQIVLVDALTALNAGAGAVKDLETALADILACFRTGQSTWLSSLIGRRIDRIVFAATKADHLHHTSHDRLEAILKRLVRRAAERAAFTGAEVDVIALAAVRATREAMVRHDGATLPAILGVPLPGETMDGETFDGKGEIAVFPGDLPTDVEALFGAVDGASSDASPVISPLRFLRFRPPKLEVSADGLTLSLPHIRLDKALQFLLGDKLA